MSADLLRRAAAEMREDAADLQPWNMWDPAVALAVADWLDYSARHEVSGYALAVARAYLGDDA